MIAAQFAVGLLVVEWWQRSRPGLMAGRPPALPGVVGFYVACWTFRPWTDEKRPARRGTRM